MVLFVTLSAMIVLTAIAVKYVQWCLSYWKRKGVSTIEPQFLLGNAQDVLFCRQSLGITLWKLAEYFKKLKIPFFGYYIFIQPIFVPVQIDLIKKMLISDFEHFTDRVFMMNEMDHLGSNLFSLNGSKWKHLRAKISPAFTKSKCKMMFPTIKACVDRLLEILDDFAAIGKEVEIKDFSSRLTMDILASCAFGLDIDALKNDKSEFRHYGLKVFDTSVVDALRRLCIICLPKLSVLLKLNVAQSDVTKFFLKTVKNTIKYREENNIVRNDLMHLLLQIKNNVNIENEEIGVIKKTLNEKDSLSSTEIAAQCFIFFLAGYESSSSIVSFCLYELCLNKSLQEKARQDVINAVNQNDGELNYDTLLKTTYLEKCIKETSRKYPILPTLFRTCTKTYKVPDSNVIIDKGTMCFISTLSLHYDKEMYPNPETFDPERFSEENIAKRHSLSWIPFGDGPRICIAFQLGLLQSKLTLAALLLNYEFTLNSKTKLPLVMDAGAIITSVKNSIWLNVKKIG